MSHARWVGAVGFVALVLAGCVDEDVTTPTDPQNAAGTTSMVQSDLLTVVEMSPSALSGVQQERLALLQARDWVAEVYVAELANDPTSFLREGEQISINISPTNRYTATLERITQHESGNISGSGPLQDGFGRLRVTLDAENRDIMGWIEGGLPIVQYGIQPLGDRLHAVYLVDPAGFDGEDIVVGSDNEIPNVGGGDNPDRLGKADQQGPEAMLANTQIRVNWWLEPRLPTMPF